MRAGYLGELRLDRAAHGRFDVLRGGYRFFHEQRATAPADIHFTSIAADNVRARRLLERSLPALPRYEFLAELTTLLISTAARRVRRVAVSAAGAPRLPTPPATALEPASAGELADFLNACGARHQFAAAWTPQTITSLAAHALPLESFGVLRDRGKIVAAAALWDQRPFRQTVIHGYSPLLALSRPLINTIGPFFGGARLPPRGSVLAHAFLSPLALAPHREPALFALVTAFHERARQRGIDFLTLALPSGDPRLAALRRQFRCRTYASRLYRVRWPDEAAPALDRRTVLPDVSLL
jgi:hypothetical protein